MSKQCNCNKSGKTDKCKCHKKEHKPKPCGCNKPKPCGCNKPKPCHKKCDSCEAVVYYGGNQVYSYNSGCGCNKTSAVTSAVTSSVTSSVTTAVDPCNSPCKSLTAFNNVTTGSSTFTILLPCEVKGRAVTTPAVTSGSGLTITSMVGRQITVTSTTALTASFTFTYSITTLEKCKVRCYNVTQVSLVSNIVTANTCNTVTLPVQLGTTSGSFTLASLTGCNCSGTTVSLAGVTSVTSVTVLNTTPTINTLIATVAGNASSGFTVTVASSTGTAISSGTTATVQIVCVGSGCSNGTFNVGVSFQSSM